MYLPNLTVKSFTTFFQELMLLIWVLMLNLFLNYSGLTSNEKAPVYLIALFTVWFVIGLLTHGFPYVTERFNYYKVLADFIKFYVLILAVLLALKLFIIRNELLWDFMLESTVIYIFWSITIITVYYLLTKPPKTDEVGTSFFKATSFQESMPIYDDSVRETKYRVENKSLVSEGLGIKLKTIYLQRFPEVYDFLKDVLDLDKFDLSKSVILRSRDPYNVEILPENALTFFFNLQQMNHIRRINSYLIGVNKRLEFGGVVVGCLEPIKYRHKRFLRKYPFIFAEFFYLIDFIWRRVFPKLPFLQKVFFAFTKGMDRALSLAEGLGRLYYCGFEVLGVTDINNHTYYVARKIKEPSTDRNPSYGPLFKMKRVGKGGKMINVYKLRTMHPYAEYLQDFVYRYYSLKEGGKFNNDFRITPWGVIMRRFWFDELPMIINLFKGELKIVGVRPISRHYFSLYPDEVKEERIKHKPGLVPPFYADLPKTFDEIVASEVKYMEAHSAKPISTDIKYFFKAFYNIIIKKARSA